MTAGHVPDHVISAIRNACKESSASSTQIPATKAKRFDGLLSRLFSSGANAASAAVATSSPTAADAGISSEDAMDVRQRKLFVKALADHIHEQLTIVAKGSTAMISEHSAQHGTPLFPATATPTLSSAFSFSSSWKSTSPLAEIRPHDPTADGLLRTRAHATAKEYARVMHATATMVCNVLNDERSVPRASDFTGQQQQQCECVNCRNSPTAPADASATPFPRTVSGSSVSAPQPLPPPSAQLPPAAAALFAQLHRKSNGTQQQRGPAMRSRFDYVSNVMRANLVGVAGGASDGGAASFVSPLSPLPKMNGGTGDVTVLAPRARHAADLSIHGMRSTYVLLHALALAMVELAVSAPVGFHTKFTTVGFHVLPRRYRTLVKCRLDECIYFIPIRPSNVESFYNTSIKVFSA